MKIRILLTGFACVAFLNLPAQERVSELEINPSLANYHKKKTEQESKDRTLKVLWLPFSNDFSNSQVYPSSSHWADNCAFVNSQYPVKPLSLGVATLDALDSEGKLYAHADFSPFLADSLTSQIIRLDSIISPTVKKLSPADSVILSFFYQPQGLGNAPDTDDSLIVEFYTSSTGWRRVWGTPGMKLTTFYSTYGVWFHQVKIPITDTAFFKPDFQFRFRNYASLSNQTIPSWSANTDQWHIDYVYLDINRSKTGVELYDVAFREAFPKFLNNYTSLPWSQYVLDSVNLFNHNLKFPFSKYGGLTEVVNLSFKINNLVGGGGNYKTDPLVFNYGNTTPNTDTVLLPTPNFQNYHFRSATTNQGMVDFEIIATLSPGLSTNTIRSNDTLRFYQRFYNYYSYDDGIPEAGYGLTPAGSRLALQFKLNHPDSLRSVQMFFNQTLNNANVKPFYLTVWNDNSGKPGTVIYEKAGCIPEYNGLNQFYTYELDQAIPVSGTFYVGWRQTTDDNLNLGYDKNNNCAAHTFYNTDGIWRASIYSGAVMIRPILGKSPQPYQNIHENTSDNLSFTVFPNPLSGDIVSLKVNNRNTRTESLIVSIYNNSGQLVVQQEFNETMNISDLTPGVYQVVITGDNINPLRQKLVKIR